MIHVESISKAVWGKLRELSASWFRESVIGSCLGLDFVTEGRSLIPHGKTGRGKTHLAVAIGYRFETLFTTAAELIVLFHVVNDRHLRKQPLIFTTNKPMNDWGKVQPDEDIAAAILDRVLERGRFIHLDGPSGRTCHLHPEETLPEKYKTAQDFRNW